MTYLYKISSNRCECEHLKGLSSFKIMIVVMVLVPLLNCGPECTTFNDRKPILL